MSKTLKLRSLLLHSLNEALQKMTINDTIKEHTPIIVEADGKFSSIIQTADEDTFDPTKLTNDIEVDTQNIEKNAKEKEDLISKASDAIKKSLDSCGNLRDILTKLKELNTDTTSNVWKVNDEGNTAILQSRNAQIFRQNGNICLSHNGKIELFKTVKELRSWLETNNYPLPGNIAIKESKQRICEDFDISALPFSKNHPEEIERIASISTEDLVKNNKDRNWFDLVIKQQHQERAAAISDKNNTKNSNDSDLDREKSISNKILTKSEYNKKVDDSKADKKAHPDVVDKMNMQPKVKEECCGSAVTTANLGPAVAYTAKKEEAEDTPLKEYTPQYIPEKWRKDISANIRSIGEEAKYFVQWIKQHLSEIKSKEIVIDNDVKSAWKNVIAKKFIEYQNTYNSNTALKTFIYKFMMNKVKTLPENVQNQAFVSLISTPEQDDLDELTAFLNERLDNAIKKAGISSDSLENCKIKSLLPGDPLLEMKTFQRNSIPIDSVNLNKKVSSDSSASHTHNSNEFKNWCTGWTLSALGVFEINQAIMNSKPSKNTTEVLTHAGITPVDTVDKQDTISPEKAALIKKLQDQGINPNSPTAKKILATMFSESTSLKYAWMRNLIGQRLVEDNPTPEDFATNVNNTGDIDTSIDTNSDNTADNIDDLNNFDIDTDLSDTQDPSDFGNLDININSSDYSPEEDGEDIKPVNVPEYEIIDVLKNEDEPNEIYVQVRNKQNKNAPLEIKKISEIDV